MSVFTWSDCPTSSPTKGAVAACLILNAWPAGVHDAAISCTLGGHVIAQFHEVIVGRDVRHHVTLPTSSVVTVVTTGMNLQLCLFFALAKSKIKLFIAHEFVMSNHKTH